MMNDSGLRLSVIRVSTACGSGRVINVEYPPATAGGTDLGASRSGYMQRKQL